MKYTLSEQEIKVIHRMLDREDRVELIPAKHGEIKIVHVQRKEIKTK